jgi:hypothetical protein
VVPQATPPAPTLSVAFGGDGFGRVTIRAPGLADQVCERDCQVSVPLGTFLTVEATAQSYSAFRNWSLAGCAAQQVCSFTFDPSVPLRADFQLAYNVAFVTDQVYTVDQLPAPGAEANQECARLAAAAGVHGQRWVAWLAAEGPTTAVGDDITPAGSLQNPGGWVRTDGAPLVTTRQALLSGELRNPLNLTQTRALAPGAAWSGVGFTGGVDRPDGVNASDCNDWTSTDPAAFGAITNRDSVGLNWTGSSVQGCSATGALECFADDPSPQVPLPALPTGARLAFASTTPFVPGNGIQFADQLCQQDACAAGLTGSGNCNSDLGTQRTFLSYLHTSLQPAWERFDLGGATWYRPDGIQWLPTAATLAVDAAGSLTGINVLPDGTIDPGSNLLWLGRANSDQNCGDWQDSSITGAYGNADDVGFALTLLGRDMFECSSPAKVLCLQQ